MTTDCDTEEDEEKAPAPLQLGGPLFSILTFSSDGALHKGRKAKSDAFGKIAAAPRVRRFSHQRLRKLAPRIYDLQRLARDRPLTAAGTEELQHELARVLSAAEKAEVDVLGAARVLRLCGSDSPKASASSDSETRAATCATSAPTSRNTGTSCSPAWCLALSWASGSMHTGSRDSENKSSAPLLAVSYLGSEPRKG